MIVVRANGEVTSVIEQEGCPLCQEEAEMVKEFNESGDKSGSASFGSTESYRRNWEKVFMNPN
jgi:hypothetical protein